MASMQPKAMKTGKIFVHLNKILKEFLNFSTAAIRYALTNSLTVNGVTQS